MYSRLGRYMPLQEDDETKPEISGPQSSQVSSSPTWIVIRWVYSITLHVFLIILLFLLAKAHQETRKSESRLLPSEFLRAQGAVHYEEITFDPSGFWDDPSQSTPYEGAPSKGTDAMWSQLVDVGMYSLTQEEYDQLPLETTIVPGKPDEYLVTIEVFHQLHCLNYLRRRVYGGGPPQESEHSREIHLSHCVDYLRQVLMCHGDLTLITLKYDEHRQPHVMPDFRIRHTCRNFDSIWEFAAKRNTSGITIE